MSARFEQALDMSDRGRARAGTQWLLLLSILLGQVSADSYDIFVQLFQDENCFEKADSLLLINQACYANLYSNDSSKAFSVKIYDYEEPAFMYLNEYSDACGEPVGLAKKVKAGTSAGMCNRFIGALFAQFTMRLRSFTCPAGETVGNNTCSDLRVATHTFYTRASCENFMYPISSYPVNGECMRWFEGTQRFTLKGESEIYQEDFFENNDCSGTPFRNYSIQTAFCYPLYEDKEPRTFRWRVENSTKRLTNTARRRCSMQIAGAVALLLLGMSLF